MFAADDKQNQLTEWERVLADLNVRYWPGNLLPTMWQAVELLQGQGRWSEAAILCRELHERQPESPVPLARLVFLLCAQGKEQEAMDCQRRLIALDLNGLALSGEQLAAAQHFKEAVAGLAPPPARAPESYIASAFDRYAPEFEEHVLETLQYQGHQLLHRAVLHCLGDAAAALDVMDAGCGTGLAGVCFRPLARRLDGVDLSPGMLERARARQLYERLDLGELAAVLSGRPLTYDLVIAADVFIYLGDLDPAFAAAAVCLRPGGLLAFTVERGDEPGYALLAGGHYAHHADYLRGRAHAAGFATLSLEPSVIRQQHRQPVSGYVVVLRKGAMPQG